MSDVDPTINGVGGEGFAVDGTDSFAIDPELPPDEPAAGPPPNRRGLFLTVATGLVLLLVVVIAGSAGGDDRAGLRGEDVETTDPERSTTTTDSTDETDPEPDTERSGAVSGDDLRSPGDSATEFDDEATEDTFDDFDDFDEFDDFTVDDFDFDLDEYEDEFDDFTDDDDFSSSGGGRYLPRRVPYVPSTRRPSSTVPPWYRPPTTPATTDPEDTEPDETTTTVADPTTSSTSTSSTTTTSSSTTTTTTTAPPAPVPPGPWANAASAAPPQCTDGLHIWARTGGLIAGLPNGSLYGLAAGTGTWTLVSSAVGPHPYRAFAPDSTNADRFWIVDAQGVLRSVTSGTVEPVTGAPSDVRHLSVQVAPNGEATLFVAAGQPAALSRLAGGVWTTLPTPPASPAPPAATIDGVVVTDGQFFIGGSLGVHRLSATQEWTQLTNRAVVGAPVVSGTTVTWLLADRSGLARGALDAQSWTATSSDDIAPTASGLVALPGGGSVTLGLNNTLVSSTDGSTWNPYGPSMPYAPAGVVRLANGTATFIWKTGCGADSVMRLPD